MNLPSIRAYTTLAALAGLGACGAGNTPAPDANTSATADGGPISLATVSARAGAVPTISREEAARFLARATFGASPASIDAAVAVGPEAWLDAQFVLPPVSHLAYVDREIATLPAKHLTLTPGAFYSSFWKQAASADDQLRQRVAFALSEIFVVSFRESAVSTYVRGVASYYDMLNRQAFGNFRDLLGAVATHPMMGVYLSHLRNQKESGARIPDENFAREVMQLFTIGLYQLNEDGTPKQAGGKPIETYGPADVKAMARVFTGWSWAGPDKSWSRFIGTLRDPNREITPMQMYPAYHSTSEKVLLGTTIPGSQGGEAEASAALDILFKHPNTGPFIGRQLIQRLVTSNPSPAYVGRVARAFANNGKGVRGDMKAVIKAVLLDPEASMPTPNAGKLREPIVRITNWMRAFSAKSASGNYPFADTDSAVWALAQTPMLSPSVFNYYRPGYTPPNSNASRAGLVAPEMQITSEPSIGGYLNYLLVAITRGIGTGYDVRSDYAAELALAASPAALLDRINLLLMGGTMSSTLRNTIITALNGINCPAATSRNADSVLLGKRNRVQAAIYLTMASPEYLVQK